MRRFLGPVMVLAVLALGSGCADTADDDLSASNDELRRALTATDADNGKTLTIEKGQSLILSLSSNATTGYQWTVTSTDRTLGYPAPREGTYQMTGPATGVGVGGKQVFTWKTDGIKPSTKAHAITLEYRRAWEDDDTPAVKTFKLKLKVKAASAASQQEEEEEPSEPVVLFDEHDGSNVRVSEGQDLVIRLAENPTTGYHWLVSSDGALTKPQSEYEGSDSGRVGAGGTRVLTWHTDGKIGSYAIKLKYSRGAAGTAAKTFSVTVDVVAADADEGFECPPASRHTINCMPPTPAGNRAYCAADYRSWASSSCDVSYVD